MADELLQPVDEELVQEEREVLVGKGWLQAQAQLLLHGLELAVQRRWTWNLEWETLRFSIKLIDLAV